MKANAKGEVLVEKTPRPSKKKTNPQDSQSNLDTETQRSVGGSTEFLFGISGQILPAGSPENEVKYRCQALNKTNAVRKYEAWREENVINKGIPKQSNRF